MAPIAPPVAGTVTLFTTPWCGFCRSLKHTLGTSGISFNEVDIEQDADAVGYVMSVNNGDQTVPTVLFPDGTTLTNPSLRQVRTALGA